MKIWIDAQLSPSLAPWLATHFHVEARAVRDMGLRDSSDREIFFAAREAAATVLTKDSDFVQLLDRHGPPPRILWLTAGNTSNDEVRRILSTHWPRIQGMLVAGEPLIELRSRQ